MLDSRCSATARMTDLAAEDDNDDDDEELEELDLENGDAAASVLSHLVSAASSPPLS